METKGTISCNNWQQTLFYDEEGTDFLIELK